MKRVWNTIKFGLFSIIVILKVFISTIKWSIWTIINNMDTKTGQAKYEEDVDVFSKKLIKVFTGVEV